MKVEIINLITQCGRNPEDSASVTGTLHRAWIDIKNAFVISDLESSTLQNVMFGENAAIQSYQDALDTNELNTESFSVIGDQLKRIKDSAQEFRGIAESIKS